MKKIDLIIYLVLPYILYDFYIILTKMLITKNNNDFTVTDYESYFGEMIC